MSLILWLIFFLKDIYGDPLHSCDVNNGGCTSICRRHLQIYQCDCKKGFILKEDGKTCLDINECLENNGGCEQTCVNTLGTFHCECENGYNFDEKANICKRDNEQILPIIDGVSRIGCYKDKNQEIRPFQLVQNMRSSIIWSDLKTTVTRCRDFVKETKYKYFGIEFYGECWYGIRNGVPNFDKDGLSTNCYANLVGQENALMVYRID